MEIRGKATADSSAVSFSRVCEIVSKISQERYDGNVIVHPDARPISGAYNPHGPGTIDGYGFAGRIYVASSSGPGARRSWSGRRMPVACWHAYRDALRAILTEYPHATVKTAMARYVGLEGFERVYPSTAGQNIGSMMQPAYMPDLCECADGWE